MLSKSMPIWLDVCVCKCVSSYRQNSEDLCFVFKKILCCFSLPATRSLRFHSDTHILSGQTHWKHYLNHISLTSVSFTFSSKSEALATSSRLFHLFLWQIKILKSRWGVSIWYANLRSVQWPLIHDLWKHLISFEAVSPSSARIGTRGSRAWNLYFNVTTVILGLATVQAYHNH